MRMQSSRSLRLNPVATGPAADHIGRTNAVKNTGDSTQPQILSFGYAQPELRNKHAFLSKMGFGVTSVSKFESLKLLLRRGGQSFPFLLIGPEVPEQERIALTNLYRRQCPGGKLIFFYRGSIRNCEDANALLNEDRSPENLLDTINILMQHRSRQVVL